MLRRYLFLGIILTIVFNVEKRLIFVNEFSTGDCQLVVGILGVVEFRERVSRLARRLPLARLTGLTEKQLACTTGSEACFANLKRRMTRLALHIRRIQTSCPVKA